MLDFLIVVIVALVTVPTAVYLFRRRGSAACVGCPDAEHCKGKCNCGKKSPEQ